MIEQIGQFLLALKKLLEENKLDEARQQLDQAYREWFGLDPNFVLSAPEDYLLLLTSGRVGEVDKLVALSDLLEMEGQLCERLGDYETSSQCNLKALNILAESILRQNQGTSNQLLSRVEMFVEKLEDDELPLETHDRLFRLYEQTGKFAAAEDRLFQLIEATSEDERVVAQGMTFYQRLLARDDHELKSGGLPREEVAQGLAELMRMRIEE
jgi:tetratricopeptide (TPR) repeat protein